MKIAAVARPQQMIITRTGSVEPMVLPPSGRAIEMILPGV
jgi:hypothetical protein